MNRDPAILWFRNDLRLSDNAALAAAVKRAGSQVVCVYIRETDTNARRAGGASDWWLDKSLRALQDDLRCLGGDLILRSGNPAAELAQLIRETGATSVFWNRRYAKQARDLDADIKATLRDKSICVETFNGTLLNEPWTIATKTGAYYKVFTPYWRAASQQYACPSPAPSPTRFTRFTVASDALDDWTLHPNTPDWSTGFAACWAPGERSAKQRLNRFLDTGINGYVENRDIPSLERGTSGLSPHLAFGEISPAQIWRAIQLRVESGAIHSTDAWKFLAEIGWREFSYSLLFHNSDLATANFKTAFDHMPWHDDDRALTAWQRGRTGYPIVDAGMRQLWTTGWMHNRVRMIVASFLTKHLLIDWRHGESWFWDALVDADPASNSASWQWVAGSGADAAPYFRIFNPFTQGEKFDPAGAYVRTWCPELARLPNKYIHRPWDADAAVLADAQVVLGETYPTPIIAHAHARERALSAYQTLKERRHAA